MLIISIIFKYKKEAVQKVLAAFFVYNKKYYYLTENQRYMSKVTFKDYSQGQLDLFPATLDSWISENAPVRIV